VEKVDVCFLSVLPDAVQEGFAARLAGTPAHLGLQRRAGIQGSGTANAMIKCFGSEVKNIVFACIPASSAAKNELRYKAFCHRVCELTGAENGYEHVRVCGERKTIHDNRKNEDEVRKANVVEFDEPFFDNKMVLVFDDVITKGLSYAKYANQLERLGACVIGGMFLARTHYKVR